MKKTKKPLAPLRKIVDTEISEYGVEVEILECGHKQNRKQDIYGHTNAYRRRCKKCMREKENAGSD